MSIAAKSTQSTYCVEGSGRIGSKPRLDYIPVAGKVQGTLLTLQKQQVLVRLFIDGLDECGQDAEAILEMIEGLIASMTAVKICVSSRSEQLFVDAFSHYPNLRLRDLNASDINKIIENDLFAKPIVARLLGGKDELRSELKSSLQAKAQGVFLWVSLPIRNLLRGITNRDTLKVLLKRLDSLLDDLDKLYTRTLSRNELDSDYYRSIAALYFKLVMHRLFSMIGLYLAAERNQRDLFLDPSQGHLEI